MLFKNHYNLKLSSQLCEFLKKEFSLNDQAINLAIKKSEFEFAPISIILFNYGMINIYQYQILLDWIEENDHF